MTKSYEMGIPFGGRPARSSRFLAANMAEGVWNRLIRAKAALLRIHSPEGDTGPDRSNEPRKFEEIRDRGYLDITRNIR